MAWDLTPNGNFTIKSAYPFMFSKDPCPILWRKVWITNLIPKINFFWWTTQHGIFLTLDNLKKKGFYITNYCCLCEQKEESIYHLFIECQFVVDTRLRFGKDCGWLGS